ncbi:MAG: tRNA 2-thiouridine(34) synthase MnmA [Planctomycetota bacterium]|nr:tRNA 2-thiouridine(34) synthase MnmA [Planctomycetota bacterium]
MSRVVLAMSGGVDSSAAAYLLQEQGHDVIGVFMRQGEKSAAACSLDGQAETSPLLPILEGRADHKQGCCSASDAEDARRVAQRLGIPFYALNLEREFSDIIEYFVDEYALGRTPNPCVVCNNHLKFGKLFDYAESCDAEFVATGHYARLERLPHEETPALLRGVDASKDQSYVLFGVAPSRLDRMLLPIGGYRKTEIRELASRIGLNVAEKRDSQEICFVTSGKHAQFVRDRLPPQEFGGEFVTINGEVVGRHSGIEGFTIGQRKGLGIAMGEPYFVVGIEPETRRVVIGPREALAQTALVASRTNWLISGLESSFQCEAKIRYNSPAVPATVETLDDGRVLVEFPEPCFGVAPGQAVVFYEQDRVLGGGWIQQTGTREQLADLPPESHNMPLGRFA